MGLFIRKSKKAAAGTPRRRIACRVLSGAVFALIGLVIVLLFLSGKDAPLKPPAEEVASSLEQRPRMKLKKPRVQRIAQPRTSARILSRFATKSMPEFRVPDLGGVGEGLLGMDGVSGLFAGQVESVRENLFGSTMGSGNDLEVTFYSFEEEIGHCLYWVAHYRGKIVHKEGITFRFWGSRECVLTVAVDRELVLSANLPSDVMDAYTVGQSWSRRA